MSHSTWLALALVSLFVVYVTMRGHLPDYLATVLGPFPTKETGSKPGYTGGGPSVTDPDTPAEPGSGVGGAISKGAERIFSAPSWDSFWGSFGKRWGIY